MSSSYKSSVKEMRKERRKAKQHPTNVRHCDQGDLSTLDTFGVVPKQSNSACSDCGADLTGKPIRWAKGEKKDVPYCRDCFLTRFGKPKLQEES